MISLPSAGSLLLVLMVLPYAAYWGWQYSFFVIICALICLVLLLVSNSKDLVIAKSSSAYCLAGFTVSCLFSLYQALDKSVALLGVLQIIATYLFYLICIQWKHQAGSEMERQVKEVLVSCGFILSGTGLLLSFHPDTSFLVLTEGRLSAGIAYPNTFATYLLICIILSNGIEKKRGEIFFIQMILWAALLLSFSRINYVLAGISLIAVVALHRDRWLPVVSSAMAGCLLGWVLSLSKNFIGFAPRVRAINPMTTEWLERLFYYKDGLWMILDHPLGVGARNSYLFQGQYQSALYYDVPLMHNGVLQLAADFGIVATILFLAAFGRSFFKGKKKNDRTLAMIILFVHGLVDFDWKFVVMLNLFVVFIALEEECFEFIRMRYSKPYFSIAVLIFMVGVSVWAFAFDLNAYLGKNDKALQWNPYYTQALVADSRIRDTQEAITQLQQAESASGFMDESVYVELLRRNKEAECWEDALYDAECLIKLRPLKIEYVEEKARLSLQLAHISFQQGQWKQAAYYSYRILEIEDYLREVRKKIPETAYALKHKPNMVMTESLTQAKKEALQLTDKIKNQKEGE